MTRDHTRSTLAACVALGMTGPCLAGFMGTDVFVNPLNNSEFGWNSNIIGGLQQAADDVTLGQDATIDRMTFYGFDQSGLSGNNFRLRFFEFNDALGEPQATPFYDEGLGFLQGVDTGLNNNSGFDIFEFNVDIPDVALMGGVDYWIMIGSTDGTTWTWSHSDPVGPPDDQFHRSGDGSDWRSLRALGLPDARMDQAFTLTATPAPGALAMLGLAGVLARRRRRV